MASPQSPLAADVARRERLRRIQLEAEAQRQAEWEAWLRAHPAPSGPGEAFREMAATPRLAGWTLANLPSDLAEGVARGTNWLIGQGAELLGVAGAADATALGARRIEGALDRAPLVGGLRRRRAAAREAAGILALPTEVLADPSLVGLGAGAARAGAARLARVPAELEQARRAMQALPGAMAIPAWHGTPHTWRPAAEQATGYLNRGGQRVEQAPRAMRHMATGEVRSTADPRQLHSDLAMQLEQEGADPRQWEDGWLLGGEFRSTPEMAARERSRIEAGELGQPARHTRLTGEGAQAYGAGDLYSAEAPGVARSYAQQRGDGADVLLPSGRLIGSTGPWDRNQAGDAGLLGFLRDHDTVTAARTQLQERKQRIDQAIAGGEDALRALPAYRGAANPKLMAEQDSERLGGWLAEIEGEEGRIVPADSAYWLTLDDGRRVLVDPEHPDEGIARAARQLRQIASGDGQADLGQAREALRRHVAQLRSPVVREEPAAALALLERARSIEPAAPQPQMYRVALPGEREQYLSWDEPLGEPVRKRLQAFLATQPEKGALGRTVRYPARKPEIPKGERGATVYRNLSQYFGSDEAASDALAAAGIPGIRYRDAMSRKPELNVRALEDGAEFARGRQEIASATAIWARKALASARLPEHERERLGAVVRIAKQARDGSPTSGLWDAAASASRLAYRYGDDSAAAGGLERLLESRALPKLRSTENLVSFRGEDVVPLARGPKNEGISAIEQRATERLGQLIDYHSGPAGHPERREELRRLYREMTGRDYGPTERPRKK